eukprot:95511-Alexandrium_andersonii.AAC.1
MAHQRLAALFGLKLLMQPVELSIPAWAHARQYRCSSRRVVVDDAIGVGASCGGSWVVVVVVVVVVVFVVVLAAVVVAVVVWVVVVAGVFVGVVVVAGRCGCGGCLLYTSDAADDM